MKRATPILLVFGCLVMAFLYLRMSREVGRFSDINDAENRLSSIGTCHSLYDSSHKTIVVANRNLSREQALALTPDAYRFRGKNETRGIAVVIQSDIFVDPDDIACRRFGLVIAFGDPVILDQISQR